MELTKYFEKVTFHVCTLQTGDSLEEMVVEQVACISPCNSGIPK